ncbi:DUF2993 domain-containing protein [Cryobacterium sp. TMT1-21]|uniref:DUF2993 domain-containing protein n=1 Tax=Cryobacterium shii TaxID=1259235 RepID=A0AAQ2C4F2_9MICO|nr:MULTISPECIES: DUF2993 domain-containing protein [Cryobacterium]TFC42516.1 DUF2993 domain-containing protein [Cryobacterium shii]TFC80848.1 DUF2993 domain-containing protein [Cryobacterium sp. TmT2-59]TFD13225.1 DUF2993 domain-containing protein [Cryobacterium sp. TMT1-21]TFD18646.1 DUF2993 domain-containing protein [Cryobacterium sp. TMT4-10]TFD28447.1 DUF2993 domain-containing protein [Cryobacterium sp. TMT2-23]
MDASARRTRRRGLGAQIVVGLSLLGLVAAFFFVDAGMRGYAERQVKQEIASNLPKTVTGDVSVSIGGLSVIWQYLAGSFDRVDLKSSALSVDGVPASVHVVATDVPLDRSRPVGDVRGIVDLGPAALNTLLSDSLLSGAADAGLELGQDEVSYTGSIDLLGFPIDYRATASPTVDAGSVLLRPTGARITSGAGGFDVGDLLSQVMGEKPVRICVASYLPDGVTLSGVTVTPERARLTLQSSSLTLNRASLTTLGSCAG